MNKCKYLALFAVAATIFGASSIARAQGQFTVASWGGAFQDAQRKAWFDVVGKELGVKVAEATTSGIADVRLQVASGNPAWDLVELDNASCQVLENEGKAEPLDRKILELKGFSPLSKGKTWISNLVYSTVIGWSSKAYPGKAPASWADFWNTKKFPGGRTMYRNPLYTMEAALLADGVPMEQVYAVLNTPAGVDRAFKKLGELKESVNVWWDSGAQSAQVLRDGDVNMAELWNGRVQTLMNDGAPVNFTYNQQMLITDCWMIPKGAKQKDLAMKAIEIMSRPEVQARIALFIDYAPANALAYTTGVIPEDKAKKLPSYSANAEKGFTVDPKFWAKNVDKITQRFNLFLQQ